MFVHFAADGIADGSGRTDCVQVVPRDMVVEDPELVTCPMCQVVMRARSFGSKASHAIKLGKDSGIFRHSSKPPPLTKPPPLKSDTAPKHHDDESVEEKGDATGSGNGNGNGKE